MSPLISSSSRLELSFSDVIEDAQQHRHTPLQTVLIPKRLNDIFQALTTELQIEIPLMAGLQVVAAAEICQYNSDYRGKDTPTNILAFPSIATDDKEGIDEGTALPLVAALQQPAIEILQSPEWQMHLVDEDLEDSTEKHHNSNPRVYIGDLIACEVLIEAEARTYQKPLAEYWSRILVHGLLHLLGYTHEHLPQRQQMEATEIHLMDALGYSHPFFID